MTPYDQLHKWSPGLAPWPAEEHACGTCGMVYADLGIQEATRRLTDVPDMVREAVSLASVDALRERPCPATWSVVEYVCHLRDVYAVYTIRLHRAQTEELPSVEPMFNDLRAQRFRYIELGLGGVLEELEANLAGFADEVAAVAPHGWDRAVTRLEERRSSRWLLRQALHEGQHHAADIRRVGVGPA